MGVEGFEPSIEPVRHCLREFARECRVAKLRSMRQFAEDEIVIPDGPYAGLRWTAERQPFCGLWLNAVDSVEVDETGRPKWYRFVTLGDVQGGKTFTACVIPALYHLFERGDKVIYGIPDADMAQDKWLEDLLPAISATRYASLLPAKGKGSQGGFSDEIYFQNGASLKFMSYRGGDHVRSGYTAAVAVCTEVDKGDTAAAVSRETDPITQIERRLKTYLRLGMARVYLECTVSIPAGRIWQEYSGDREQAERDVDRERVYSTEGRLVLPCPHCRDHVTLGREDLVGWREASTVLEAERAARFCCPGCRQDWTEAEWREANTRAVVLHRGQSIDRRGRIKDTPPETRTMGFRWTAANDLLIAPSDIAAAEWTAREKRDGDEGGKRDLLQFWWVEPFRDETELEVVPLSAADIDSHVGALARGRLPRDAEMLTACCDVGMYALHWAAVAWRVTEAGHVPGYGPIETGLHPRRGTADERRKAVKVAVPKALEQFAAIVEAGMIAHDGEVVRPGLVIVDAGYLSSEVHKFVKRLNRSRGPGDPLWMASVGRGTGQLEDGKPAYNYQHPKAKTKVVRYIGERFHLYKHKTHRHHYLIADADYWKEQMHDAFRVSAGEAGSLSLFTDETGRNHRTYIKHLTAEQLEPQESRHGSRMVWTRHGANHYGDATYGNLVAAQYLRVLIEHQRKQSSPTAKQPAASIDRGGDAFLITER